MKKTICILLTALLLPLCAPALSETSEKGYFLSLKQKGQLLGRGRIQDTADNWYDIYICPGYTYPVQYGKKNLKQAGRNLKEYVQKKKYKKIRRHSGDAFDWAFKDCLYEYVWKGTGKEWNKNFSAAKKRTKKRIFGWWLSYPWAIMESSIDNIVRIPVGLTGTVLGTLWGGAVVPVAGMTDSAIKGAWNGGVEGLALPATGLAWNTAISPPLALFGQKPAKKRVDGFWVRSVSSGKNYHPSEKELSALIAWGTLLQRELSIYKEQRDTLSKNTSAQMKALYEEQKQLRQAESTERSRITRQERARAEELLSSSEIQDQKWSSLDVKENLNAIRRQLEKQSALSNAEQSELLRLLRKYPPNYPQTSKERTAPKTDPVQESIKVLKTVPDDI